jgi:hypothetical protein
VIQTFSATDSGKRLQHVLTCRVVELRSNDARLTVSKKSCL